jgi:SAM-dependent methyltransferase
MSRESERSSFVADYELYDRMLGPLGRRALDAARIGPGHRVIDVGCGAGGSTLEVARRVGPEGHAIGVDTDPHAVATARRRAEAAGLEVEWIVADAARYPFEPAAADAVVSRFGTLHFDDPVAAFETLRRALSPGGRLAFVCARSMEDNPWVTAPLEAAEAVVGPLPRPKPDGGPFALADGARTRSILEDAGFEGVELERLDDPLRIGADVEDAVATFERTDGRALMGRVDPESREALREAIASMLRDHVHDDGVAMPASWWCVSARAFG